MPHSSAVLDLFSTPFNCAPGVAVGKAVYLSGSDTVALADAADAAKMPALGVVINKPTTTTCIIQLAGELSGVLSGLTPGAYYYVATGGTGNLVTPAPGAAVVAQIVGQAIDATTLLVFQASPSSENAVVTTLDVLSLHGSQSVYVDTQVGLDTNPGTVVAPFKTIGAALASIVDAATTKRYVICVAAGVYPEGGLPLTWKSFVSLHGEGPDATIISNGINYTGLPGETSRINWDGVRLDGTININLSAALNTNLRMFDCLGTGTFNWNGGPNYAFAFPGPGQANNLLTHSCSWATLHIIDGAAHLYDNFAILVGLTIDDGPSAVPPSIPFLEICGGLVQGTISLTGRAAVYARGVLNTANLTGAIASATTPVWEADEGSLPLGTVTGPVNFQFDDDQFASPTSGPFTITKEDLVFANATAGAFSVMLPKAANYAGRPICVIKTDASANAVTIDGDGAETINGAATQSLPAQYSKMTVVSNGTTWFIVGP